MILVIRVAFPRNNPLQQVRICYTALETLWGSVPLYSEHFRV